MTNGYYMQTPLMGVVSILLLNIKWNLIYYFVTLITIVQMIKISNEMMVVVVQSNYRNVYSSLLYSTDTYDILQKNYKTIATTAVLQLCRLPVTTGHYGHYGHYWFRGKVTWFADVFQY